MKSVWINTLAWLGAVLVALALAFAGPTESSVMGRLPALMAKRLDQQPVLVPQGFPAERTLALIAFDRSHREAIDSWVRGLGLHANAGQIPWVRMPVLNDPGNPTTRGEIENRLLLRFPGAHERATLVPLFTDRAAFVRSVGLSGTQSAVAVVVNRRGEVLARAEGPFDVDKADALLETLGAKH